MKIALLVSLPLLFLALQPAQAAKDSGSAKTIKKLQLMVREANSEKDRLTTENAKLLSELEALKKQAEQSNKAKTALEAKEKKLNAEVAAQTKLTGEYRNRLNAATTRIHEIIDKYNTLNQSKDELAAELAKLNNTQQFTSSELKRCETNNVKMYEGAKKVIGSYEKCQQKGIVDTLIDSEPFTGIKDVEFETLAQEYEDKLRKQRFNKPESSPSKP